MPNNGANDRHPNPRISQLIAAREARHTAAPVALDVTNGPTLTNRNRRTVVGAIPASALLARYVIPYRNHRDKDGYQREPSQSRINELARVMAEKRVDLPTAILVNLRTFKPRNVSTRGGRMRLHLADEPLYVVDGQHRVLALERLMRLKRGKGKEYTIPFVCLLGGDKDEELEQFYVVNSTAKSVRTDLAYELLKERAERNDATMQSLIERGQAWKVRAQTITEQIAQTPLWRGKIRFPLDPTGLTTIASSGFVTSLRRLISTPFFGNVTVASQLRILTAYWNGVEQCLPGAFSEPLEYTLQKTIGTTVMHAVLVPVLEYLRSTGKSTVKAEEYAAILRGPLESLEDKTAQGRTVRGLDFWRVAPRGAAATYSSSAGQRLLIARVTALLPQIDVT